MFSNAALQVYLQSSSRCTPTNWTEIEMNQFSMIWVLLNISSSNTASECFVHEVHHKLASLLMHFVFSFMKHQIKVMDSCFKA